MTICRLMLVLAAVFVVRVSAQPACPTCIDSRLAMKQGCIKSTSSSALSFLDFSNTFPHYVEVQNPKVPPEGLTGWIRYSHVSDLDSPLDHDWHDTNFYVRLVDNSGKPNDGYNSSGNYVNNNSFLEYGDGNSPPWISQRNERLLEVEWDLSHIPARFWSSAGDHVWMKGRYIWDCGHPDEEPRELPAGIEGYHTEVHAPKAVAFTRLEPYQFPGDASLSLTNMTYVYISGRSGLRNLTSNNTTALVTGTFDTDVAMENYTFDIDLPRKPDNFSGGPICQVVDLPFGGPAPVVTCSAGSTKASVTYPLNLGDPSPDRKFAAVIATGWQKPNISFKRYTITVDQVTVNKNHNLLCQADWSMWININGEWRQVEGMEGVGVGSLIDVNQKWEIAVPDSPQYPARINVQAVGWVSVFDSVFGSPDDIGRLITEGRNAEGLSGATSAWIGKMAGATQGKLGRIFERYTSLPPGPLSLTSKRAEEVDGEPYFEDTADDFTVSFVVVVH